MAEEREQQGREGRAGPEERVSCWRPALLRAGARRLYPDSSWGNRRASPGTFLWGGGRDQERMRGGGVRTALAGLEAAAVSPGACDPEAARQADSASLAGSLSSSFSLPLSLPSLAPCSSDAARGAQTLEPSRHSLLSSRERVSAAAREARGSVFRRSDWLRTSGRGEAGRAPPRQQRVGCGRSPREAASQKSGSLARRGERPCAL